MTVEVRGRGRKWSVWYPDESGLPSSLPVYDRDGNLKTVVEVGAPTGKLVESYSEHVSQASAEEYARFLGATTVVVRKTATKAQSLAKARLAAQRLRSRKED